MKMFCNHKGFTLIELMIVVVIIGILASLAIPRFMEASKKSKMSEAKTILKQIYVASSAYHEEKGVWPSYTDLDNVWLNDGDLMIGIDAPSGRPRFAYEYRWDSGDTLLAMAYGSDKTGDGCPNQAVDASLADIIIAIDIDGKISTR